jgi:membrane-bound serine protease (ClpP class)
MILMDSSEPDLQLNLRVVVPIVFGLGGIGIFLTRLAVASQRRQPVTGAAAMIGETGKALTAIGPGQTGRVATHGESWKAIAEEPIAEGDCVTVTRVDGLTLTVRKQRP